MKRLLNLFGRSLRNGLLAIGALSFSGGVLALANYTFTQGAGTTFGSVIVSGVHYAQMFLCDLTTPSQCATVKAASTAAAATDQSFVTNESPNSQLSTAVGTTADAAASVGGTGTVEAKMRLMTTQLDNINTNIQAGSGATGAAPPASGLFIAGVGSGATGGLLTGLKTCDLHAKFDATTTGYVTLVTGVASRKIYVCGYVLGTGGTATNLDLSEDTVTNCTNAPAALTPVYQLVANDKIGVMAPFWTGLATSTNGNYICIHASAGNSHQAEIWYTIQ